MKYLIVTGGNTEPKLLCENIKNGGYEVIIAVDSGMNVLYKCDIIPDVIVGDFDSVGNKELEYFRRQDQVEVCVLNPQKDDTDTEYAIRYAVEKGANKITILGATGTRLDHVLANVGLLGIGIESNVYVEIIDEYNKVRMINKPTKILKKEQFGKYVSLIPYSDKVEGVTLKGMKYPLDDHTMQGYNSLGISNEIIEDEAEIIIKDGVLIVIESRD